MARSKKETCDYFEKKAKRDLEELGYLVVDANELRPNNEAFDLVLKRSDGSEVLISVKSTTKQILWPIANGTLKRKLDGSYDGAEKVTKKLLHGGFTIVYMDIVNRGINTVYLIPHDVIKPLFERWLVMRKGNQHTFTLNRKTAEEIGFNIDDYEQAWNLLPPP